MSVESVANPASPPGEEDNAALLEVAGLDVSYGEVRAVRALSF
jgi:hypothetical protein